MILQSTRIAEYKVIHILAPQRRSGDLAVVALSIVFLCTVQVMLRGLSN
jgi:hypothetical protein